MKQKRLTNSIFIFTIIFFVNIIKIYGQGVLITEESEKDGHELHHSVMFEVRSNDKGVLVPRLTTDERNSIKIPANSMIVYDTDEKSFYYFDSTANGGSGQWMATKNPLVVALLLEALLPAKAYRNYLE